MADNQRPIVGEIINTFKSGLSQGVREQIGDAQFADLAIMIDEAISAEISSAADLVGDLSRTLKARARGPELGL